MIIREERIEYKRRQDELFIKIGERVLISRKSWGGEMGWDNAWVLDMDKYIDTIGTVVDIVGTAGVHIKTWEKITYGYPYFVLNFIDREVLNYE